MTFTLRLCLISIAMLAFIGCGSDPIIQARYRSGQTVESVLKDLSLQREHLYIVVSDERAFRGRLAADVVGEMRMSQFLKRFRDATHLNARYYPYEPNSPRGTLKIGSSSSPVSAVYVIVRNGNVDLPRKHVGTSKQ